MKNTPSYIRDWQDNTSIKKPVLFIFDGCDNQIDNSLVANGYEIQKKECLDVYPIGKFKPKPHRFSFFIAQKN